MPENLIRGVTGHRSKAYERPTTEQLQETSAVLVQGKKIFCPGKENMPTAATQGPSVATPALPTPAMARDSRPGLFGSIFSGVTNITVNVSSTSKSSDMDSLLDGLDLDQFTQF